MASSLRAVAYTLHPFDANSSHLGSKHESALTDSSERSTHNANPMPPSEHPVMTTTCGLDILADLWTCIVNPVFEHLGFTVRPHLQDLVGVKC